MTPSHERNDLVVTRMFDAAPADVFDAWVDLEEWQAWIGPEGIDCDVTALEPRVGGNYRLVMHLPGGETPVVTGVFTVFERPSLLAFTWGGEGGGHRTLVTITFRPVGGRTELTLRQEGLPTAADRNSHDEGWQSAFNKLAAHLARSTG